MDLLEGIQSLPVRTGSVHGILIDSVPPQVSNGGRCFRNSRRTRALRRDFTPQMSVVVCGQTVDGKNSPSQIVSLAHPEGAIAWLCPKGTGTNISAPSSIRPCILLLMSCQYHKYINVCLIHHLFMTELFRYTTYHTAALLLTRKRSPLLCRPLVTHATREGLSLLVRWLLVTTV